MMIEVVPILHTSRILPDGAGVSVMLLLKLLTGGGDWNIVWLV